MVSCFNDETRARGTPKGFYTAPPPPSSAPQPASYNTAARSGPPGKADILARQLAALPLIALLYTAAVPFTPAAWLLHVGGSSLFDRLFAGIVVLAACYFQWRVAGLTAPLAVFLPGVDGGSSTVRNGRLEQAPGPGFVWQPDHYWPYAICETALLCIAEFGGNELLRRCIVCGVLGGLWLVGYHATPESTRRWAYENIKGWLFWMVLDEMMRVGGRSYNARRRR
ncbi:uncharacterized protein LY79DRAFT_518004 [Colletotrichum navitas]|uniref:M6 family metalloprotease n=1 Tax=Colletotrichum navitas TaxID=681940 RepID=A0AAD8V3G6_9PEZI|nr:uncharacterized protein LY79DRAFT_518004 [Colletotrichum navitas]KAK1585863.1 hypothetical protein LY79DRAFT_518004 [Colletotrichum navitas]